jgi:glutamate carboxypeptidase
MVALLVRLIEAESPSDDPAALRAMRSLLAGELEALGFDLELIRGHGVGDHLLARLDARPRASQLILGHFDTVWPLGTIGSMPARVTAGRVHGPGAYDMKGGLVQALFAIRAIRAAGFEPPLSPVLFFNADEEIGSPDSRRKISELSRATARAFVVEPSFGSMGKLKTARKGVGRFEVRILGKAAHAGIEPGRGASAIQEAANQIEQLFALNDPGRAITVNVGTIDGGLGANVIAPEVVLQVDARVAAAADMGPLEEGIHALQARNEGVRIEVSGGFGRPPLERTERNSLLWQQALEAARSIGIELDDALVGGASDGNLTSAHTATLDGLGAVGDGAHAPHEHVVIERMPERAALLAMLLLAPAGVPG